MKFEVGLASNGITFIQNLVKISQLVKRLKGKHTNNIMISWVYFLSA